MEPTSAQLLLRAQYVNTCRESKNIVINTWAHYSHYSSTIPLKSYLTHLASIYSHPLTNHGGKMLRVDPVSTRKYLLEYESKTWRSALLTPADKLFTVHRLGSFPALKQCVTAGLDT